jgi:tRNA(Ile)-lysidine synthase
MLDHLAPLFDQLPRERRCWVALSGGVDSLTLLDCLVTWRGSAMKPDVRAIHVHHGLAAEADEWVAQCQRYCDQWGVPLSIVRLTPVEQQGEGLEAAARRARYEAFAAVLEQGDVLLQGHHQDDQVETVLFRLLRGAGPRGLAGIPPVRPLGAGEIRRPLLNIPRSVLEAWARDRGLVPIRDPANDDLRFDRNFLRHEILPLLARRWPGYRETVTRSAALQRSVFDVAGDDTSAYSPISGEPTFALAEDETPDRLATRLHRWLAGHGIAVPGRAKLSEFARQAIHAEPDRLPSLDVAEHRLLRWRGQIYLARITSSQALNGLATVGDICEGPWGGLAWQPTEGVGLPKGLRLSLRQRRAGEQQRPLARPNLPLSQWWQEQQVPPWWRDRLPVLCGPDGAALAVLGAGLTAAAENLSDNANDPESQLLLPVWVPPQPSLSLSA